MINYIKGDVTNPVGTDNRFIIHICNDKGGWGKGFVLAVSAKSPEPERAYREWSKCKRNEVPFELGNIQKVKIEDSLWVVNMIAQGGYSPTYKVTKRYVNYYALEQCLSKVARAAKIHSASIHMPRIGTSFGGGAWEEIEPIIQRTLKDHPVTVYDL